MLRVFEPSLTWNDKFTVLKTLYKNNISGQSPSVNEFEEACANKFDRKYGISVSNGSVALDIALQSLDLKEDDEVILPSFLSNPNLYESNCALVISVIISANFFCCNCFAAIGLSNCILSFA